jgi:hypothetical protein
MTECIQHRWKEEGMTPLQTQTDDEDRQSANADDPGNTKLTRRSVLKAGMVASGSLIMSSSYMAPDLESISLMETLKPSSKPGKPGKPRK